MSREPLPLSRAVFLDKDGTLVENVPYNVDPGCVRLEPGVPEGLRLLQEEGFLLVVVSNQAGLAHGYFDEPALSGAVERLRGLLALHAVALDGFYACGHHPAGKVAAYARDCECRKPLPGLLRRAARDLHIDLAASWMVGDILNDVEAGRAAGCRTVLIDNGNETEWDLRDWRRPHHVSLDFAQAARHILEYSASSPQAELIGGAR